MPSKKKATEEATQAQAEEMTQETAQAPEEAPEKAKTKAPKPKKEKAPKKPGVIATIVRLAEEAGEQGITKEAILEHLVQAFPERPQASMKNTIGAMITKANREKYGVEPIREEGQPMRYRKLA